MEIQILTMKYIYLAGHLTNTDSDMFSQQEDQKHRRRALKYKVKRPREDTEAQRLC